MYAQLRPAASAESWFAGSNASPRWTAFRSTPTSPGSRFTTATLCSLISLASPGAMRLNAALLMAYARPGRPVQSLLGRRDDSTMPLRELMSMTTPPPCSTMTGTTFVSRYSGASALTRSDCSNTS